METEEPPSPADYEKNYVDQWQLTVYQNKKIGRYLTALTIIPRGKVVLSLAPVKILPVSKVKDFNRVLQVSPTLYSSSESETDFNNFLCHSCEPACDLSIHDDYTIEIIANRDIQPEEPITIDYNFTEEDMVAQGVDFECECQTSSCKGWIRGKKYLQEQSP